jgi:hypothetical protein
MRAIHSPWRYAAAAFLLLNAAVHVPLVPEHLEEAPYIGVLFIALSIVCVVLAGLVVARDTLLVWVAAGSVSLLALAAFVVSRTVGLPQIGDDIGNWTEPLGFPTLVAELVTIALTVLVLAHRPSATLGRHAGRTPA